jgi:hypothetical protein
MQEPRVKPGFCFSEGGFADRGIIADHDQKAFSPKNNNNAIPTDCAGMTSVALPVKAVVSEFLTQHNLSNTLVLLFYFIIYHNSTLELSGFFTIPIMPITVSETCKNLAL